MSFSDNSFTQGCGTFLLASSSPTFLADPAPTDSPWTPTTTEQPASEGDFGSLGLYGEGLDYLQDFNENFDLSCIDQMNVVDAEGITLGIPEHANNELDIPSVLGAGISDTFLSASEMLPMSLPTVEDYMEDGNPTLSSPPSTDGGVTCVEEERETVVESRQFSQNQINEQLVMARIIEIETKIEELLEWKASQTKRGIELSEMVGQILENLSRHENILSSNG
ncbi:hypothetical protein IL306_003946 [Fusarium sp. DS 682]|nr:hypothetical protein IL306_003946 [Fusarium sp. DS 682]